MSGTSVDAVDAVAVEFQRDSLRVLRAISLPIPDDLREQALQLVEESNGDLNRAARLGNRMTALYVEAVAALGSRLVESCRGIGCHGQTLRHAPNDPDGGFSIQVVNGARLAVETGLPVVTDFRSGDIALGGQGAPLAPVFHAAWFRAPHTHRAILNLGGIANLTGLPPHGAGPITGFDSGPANALLDYWCRHHTGSRYDSDGRWAASGAVHRRLLDQLLKEPYFRRPPPKSTGKDLFGPAWLQRFLEPDMAAADVQATLVELVARSVADAVRQWLPQTAEIYACGGGTGNGYLMRRLQEALPTVGILTTDALGVAAGDVEAVAFAWLARQRLLGHPTDTTTVTGARRAVVLGALYLP